MDLLRMLEGRGSWVWGLGSGGLVSVDGTRGWALWLRERGVGFEGSERLRD